MSQDSVTRTTSTSWFTRIGQSIGGALFGIVLFLGAFPLLTWNEGRAIDRAKTLESGEKAVVSIAASPIDPANEGKLVHVTGDTVVSEDPRDSEFDLSVPGLALRRVVEMYQWQEESKSETKEKLGGGEETITTYSYSKAWSSSPINSGNFQQPDGHQNLGEFPIEGAVFRAGSVTVGDFRLTDSIVDRVLDYQKVPLQQLPAGLNPGSEDLQISQGSIYVGQNPLEPAIGDMRVTFEEAKAGPVSIVAAQRGNSFAPFKVGRRGEIEMAQTGTASAEEMFASERQANVMLTWLIRLGGYLMMVFGLSLVASPMAVFADVVPFIGSIVRSGIGLFSFLVALPFALVTIALSWLFFRPLIGIPLLVLGVGSIAFVIFLLRSRPGKAAAAS